MHFCILDIETQLSAEEVGGWHKADLMRISCAVIYDSEKDEYIEFLEDQMPQLVNFLKQSDLVVGFNIKRFDYRVLSGYTDFNFNNIKTLDILEHVHTRLGYRLSLDHLARETLGVEKKADGLQALKWWKQGRISDIIDYCRKDVEITKELFKFGRANGYLLFNNKAGSKVRIPVDWQNI
jgi:DEAD/DEAH box helicase domain-containing protein